MHQVRARHLLVMWLLLLAACSRDVMVSTVLEDTGGLRPADKVYLASREVGSVHRIEGMEQAPGFIIELGLYAEHAELVQTNAVAYVPLKSPPMVVLLNPTEAAPPIAPGGRLKGLSPLEAVIWQVEETTAAATDYMEEFARKVDGYFESEEWERTRDQIDAEVKKLGSDSRATAARIVEEIRIVIESLTEEAAGGAHALKGEVDAIEGEIARLEAQGHEALVTSLRRLLEQIEAMAPSDNELSPGKQTPETS